MTAPAITLSGDAALLIPITALLPLTAILLVIQPNPYQTLVMRGILGAVAALIYALLGAADVALTEALVGTLLSTTLYAVALRSSMVLRLALPGGTTPPQLVLRQLRSWLEPLHLRLELLSEPASGDAGLHGLLLQSSDPARYELQLHRPQLHARLLALPGAADWRADGHSLVLLPSPAAQSAQQSSGPPAQPPSSQGDAR
jgi:putative multicomponent Na+:H+ antiporter subunit B